MGPQWRLKTGVSGIWAYFGPFWVFWPKHQVKRSTKLQSGQGSCERGRFAFRGWAACWPTVLHVPVRYCKPGHSALLQALHVPFSVGEEPFKTWPPPQVGWAVQL